MDTAGRYKKTPLLPRGAVFARYQPCSPAKRALKSVTGRPVARLANLTRKAPEPCSSVHAPPAFTLPGSLWMQPPEYSFHQSLSFYYNAPKQRCQARTAKLYRRLTSQHRYAILIPEPRFPAGRLHDGAWLLPSFSQKGVMIMTDYEILAIVLMIITLAFSVHNGTHK